MKINIAFIGAGNMGEAILSKVVKDFRVSVFEKDKQRLRFLKRRYPVKVPDLKITVMEADIIILAVKPQNFNEVLKNIKEYITKDKLVISIAAGVTAKFIEQRLGNARVVRTMPNLPAKVGEAITAISKGKFAKVSDVKIATKIFNLIGKTIVVDEKWIDSVTAVSGSGPAYVFLFVEWLISSAKSLGFKENQARDLAYQTLKGSVKLLDETKEKPEVLRKKVTSKGGTTEAALRILFKAKINKTFEKAIKKAKSRAKELSM
ncbi:MAG: pyrroline-5-carboxylate reductase [Candidatus Zapsychrus exili]|nr:pyrroline-5-carboxylate reductase [Candidatus Zapsychrus exili]